MAHFACPKSTSVGAPQVSIVGLADRAVQVRQGHPALWHFNVIGLSEARGSFVYPLNLRGKQLLLAIYDAEIGQQLTLEFRPPDGRKPFELKLAAGATVIGDEAGMDAVPSITSVPGWSLVIADLGFDAIVVEPGEYRVYLVAGTNEPEQYLGSLRFFALAAPPLAPEDIAAIRSDPLAMKTVRLHLNCNICRNELRIYTGLERNADMERDGWIWQHNVPDRFRCSCGEQDFSLQPLKAGFHGLLRSDSDTQQSTSTGDFVRLYERSALEEACRRFVTLIDSQPAEEPVQKFLEDNPIFFFGICSRQASVQETSAFDVCCGFRGAQRPQGIVVN